MEISAKTVLVAGIDVAANRFEGELFFLGDANEWVSVGRIVSADPRRFSHELDCLPAPTASRSHAFNDRPWLRQKKGRAAQ